MYNSKDIEEIYFPAEDSKILLDEVRNSIKELMIKKEHLNICEIGTGSGYISSVIINEMLPKNEYIFNLLKKKIIINIKNKYYKKLFLLKKWMFFYFILKKYLNINIISTDINPNAIIFSRSENVFSLYSNLFSIFNKKNKYLRKKLIQTFKFDLIFFNPPYLPTSQEEKLESYLNYSFDGGKDGSSTIIKYLEEAKKYLKNDGILLFVCSSITNTNIIYHFLKREYSNIKIVRKLKCSFETLFVIKCENKILFH